jgi:Family of unknown function (DUF6499)
MDICPWCDCQRDQLRERAANVKVTRNIRCNQRMVLFLLPPYLVYDTDNSSISSMEGSMPEHWGVGDAYSYLDDLESKAAAWEFVRRNPEYRVVYRFIVGGFATLFAQRWGCVVDPDLRADHAPIDLLFTAELP